MKILFIVRTLGYGGASKQLAMLANALSNYGNDVSIYSYCAKETAQLLDPDVSYIPEQKKYKNKFEEYFFSVLHIRSKIKEIRPDIILSWRCNAGCLTVLASFGLKIKVVFSERTDPYMETSLALKISSWICGFSDGGVFQLENVRQYYGRLYKKSIVIHNPIDGNIKMQASIPYGERPKKIVHVGRMMLVQKRQDMMLDAFKIFAKLNPEYELHFYGDGENFEFIKKMVKEKGLSGVVFHGSVKDIPENIKDAKMLVLTSAYEGIPNVILEAFATGVPVVSTDCSPGGAQLLLGDNENGLLAPIGDVQKIATQMQRIIDNQDLAETFISRGRSKLNEFLPEKIFVKWNEYLKNLFV